MIVLDDADRTYTMHTTTPRAQEQDYLISRQESAENKHTDPLLPVTLPSTSQSIISYVYILIKVLRNDLLFSVIAILCITKAYRFSDSSERKQLFRTSSLSAHFVIRIGEG